MDENDSENDIPNRGDSYDNHSNSQSDRHQFPAEKHSQPKDDKSPNNVQTYFKGKNHHDDKHYQADKKHTGQRDSED